ncbi:RNA-binding protein 34 isoform X1 [Hydra vulgaris]|uniref:RNA-binding protein 34 isoform X1 n=1 Tax=Hydra vulgaris TaxID=6087 RepID=UPI001F5EFF55|nr:RNA-binding protein 34 [Hydra vulgaris]
MASQNKYEFGMIQQVLQASDSDKVEKKKKKAEECTNQALVELFSQKSISKTTEDNSGDLEALYKEYIESANKIEEEIKDKEVKDAQKRKKKKKEKEDPERLSRTIFVGNVSLKVTRKDIKKLFAKFGNIETIRIRSVPVAESKLPKKVALLQKKFHKERDSMNAYVVFKEKSSAEKALESNGYLLEGLHLRVDKADFQKVDQKLCLFVGNLPFSLSDEELRSHFKDCGRIEDIRIIRDKATGLGKGFGYVRFKNSDGVMLGLKLHESDFKGRKLRVFRSRNENQEKRKSKPSFRGVRTTSKKEFEKVLRSEGPKRGSKASNALYRIQHKHQKQIKNKQAKNNQKNMRKKGMKGSKKSNKT